MKPRQKIYLGYLVISSESELEYIEETYGSNVLTRLDDIFNKIFDEQNNFRIMKDLLAAALLKCGQTIPWHVAYPYLEKAAKTIKVRINGPNVTFWSNSNLKEWGESSMTSDITHVRRVIINIFISTII
jgi:hypothetical protein